MHATPSNRSPLPSKLLSRLAFVATNMVNPSLCQWHVGPIGPSVCLSCCPIVCLSTRPFVCPLNKEGNTELKLHITRVNIDRQQQQRVQRDWKTRLIRAAAAATWAGIDDQRSTIDQVKRNKSSRRGTMTDNRTAHGQVNYFAYIYYNLWNCPIVDRRRRSPIAAAAVVAAAVAVAAATSPCIIVNQVSGELRSRTGCTKVVKGLRTIVVVSDRPLS